MNEKPWYAQPLGELWLEFLKGDSKDDGYWAIKNDGRLVKETLEDIRKEFEKHNESKKEEEYKWSRILGGYEIILETPGIDDFNCFEFKNGKLHLKYQRVLFGKEWVFNESLELPVSVNEIDTVDYESISGITKIVIATKLPEKDIKIVNRNKKGVTNNE